MFFILCSIFYKDVFVFCLNFIFSFILHHSCIIFYPYLYLFFFPFFLLIHLSICDKNGDSILKSISKSIPVCIVISIWLMCTILSGRNSNSYTFVVGESHKGDAYIKGEKTYLVHIYFSLCLFSRCFTVLWVIFSIYVSLLSSHHAYVLDMHLSLCYCALLVACSDDHLLCYIIIVVISIWLFWCMIKLLSCFISCLLDRNLLVTLYLSFYYLLYLESLMCFVQMFQVTGIYVLSSSQLLDLGVSEFFHCSQTHV